MKGPGGAALVVAHPGHELRVHHWLERARPLVYVLSDGSGREGRCRLASTSRVLAATGARAGEIFGAMTDRALYAALLEGDVGCFTELARRLARHFVEHGITTVAGDAAEGYNPAHDVCRMVVETAAELARRLGGLDVSDHEFPLMGPPEACPAPGRSRAIHLELDAAALARKVAAARGYVELQGEREQALGALGTEAFRVECLRPAAPRSRAPTDPPLYERHGERAVAAGHYREVLRYRPHVAPVAEALGGEIARTTV